MAAWLKAATDADREERRDAEPPHPKEEMTLTQAEQRTLGAIVDFTRTIAMSLKCWPPGA